MGFFDSVKNSISGSDSSQNDFDNEKFDSSFTSGGDNTRGGNKDLKPEDPLAGNDQGMGPPGNQPQGQGPERNAPQQPAPGNSQQGPAPQNSPNSNPQAGRPQPGSSQPQVSDETRREMQEAGFNLNDQQRGDQGRDSGRGRNGSGRDDIEEIKQQNEQIIELLKRISDSLQNSRPQGNNQRRRHGGRR